MYVEEPGSAKPGEGIYVRKRKLYIILAIVAAVFLVALIFVYMSAKGSSEEAAADKKCPTIPQLAYTTALMTTPAPPLDLNKACSAAICGNPYKALGKLSFNFNDLIRLVI